jgi:hypothetical protein
MTCFRRNQTAWIGVLFVVGCSPSAPPPTDESAGRSVVEAALNAWKDAKSIQAVRDGDETLVADPRWEAGWTLERFQILEEAVDGFQARCKVRLTLKDSQGKPADETAEYVATSSPRRTVTRVSEGW